MRLSCTNSWRLSNFFSTVKIVGERERRDDVGGRVRVRCILTQKVAAVFVKEPEIPHSSSQPSEERERERQMRGEEGEEV
jgi:hypothetical protein